VAPTHFGQFAFDADTGALTRNGVPTRLQPQPARVLALLVARAGEIVTRDQLRQEIWGSDTFVDFERGLNFCVAQIRSALGDSADSPRFIETLPKRGYRFIAPTFALPPPPSGLRQTSRATVGKPATSDPGLPDPGSRIPDSGSRTPDTGSRTSVGRRGVAVAALLLLVGASVAALVLRRPESGPIRIAVVPFDNETGDTEFDRIAGGVADATVARLATPERIKQVEVIGNAAVLRRPRAFRDLKAIGQELNAHYVVLAQVKQDQARVRLIAHLIRVSDGAHVWAQTFDRDSFGLDVQAELAEAIAQSVVANAR
jgi:DNA-binding winged helix-turn-helix (wHTH) protein/TolB-like protein